MSDTSKNPPPTPAPVTPPVVPAPVQKPRQAPKTPRTMGGIVRGGHNSGFGTKVEHKGEGFN